VKKSFLTSWHIGALLIVPVSELSIDGSCCWNAEHGRSF